MWENYINTIRKIAQKASRDSRFKIRSKLNKLKKDQEELTNNLNFDFNEKLRTSENFIAHEIKHLQCTEACNSQEELHATIAHHGEKIGGIWSTINREKKPRDLIRCLKIPETTCQYKRSSVRMAELAKKYHDDLQKDDPSYPDENIRTTQTESTVKVIPDAQKLNEPENSPMSWLITEANVDKALKSAKNGSATRMDGCLYELWKILKKRHSDDTKAQKKGFNIIKTLTRVF